MIYTSDNVEVFYDWKTPCIVWRPFPQISQKEWEESFRAGINEMLRLGELEPNIGWLNDTTYAEYVDAKQVLWLRKFEADRLQKYDTFYNVAFVRPRDTFGKIAVDLYINEAKADPLNKMIIETFENIDDARLWLKAKNSKKLLKVA